MAPRLVGPGGRAAFRPARRSLRRGQL